MSRRLQICTAIVTALATADIPDLKARWLFEGEDELTTIEEGVPQAVVVPGRDERTGQQANMLERQLSGHVIFSTDAGGEFDDTRRAAVHEQLTKVEATMLALGAGAAGVVAINEQIAGVTEFDVETTFDTIIGVQGRFNARIDWVCRYRHDLTDPRTYGGQA